MDASHHSIFFNLLTVLIFLSNYLYASQENAEIFYNDSSSYDVKFYKLQLEASPEKLYLKGNTEIFAQATQRNLQKFYIQLNQSLTVDSIFIKGKKYSFSHVSDWIKVDLKQPITSNDFFSAIIYYHGVPVTSSMLGGIGIQSMNDHNIFYTLSEPYSAMDFFACKQLLIDKADSIKVEITTKDIYKVVANGILKRVENLPDSMHTYFWESHYPIAYYLIGFAISDFNEYTYKFKDKLTGDSVLFQNFLCLSNEDIEQFKSSIDNTVNMIYYFEDITGIPYPFSSEKYGHVMVPIGGGMENQTITFLENFDFSLVSHELAHSWMGDFVTCSDWQNIWLNEGFASYFGFLATQKFFPKAKKSNLSSMLSYALGNPENSIYIPLTSKYDEQRIFSYWDTYMKGAYLLHTFRYFIGSDSLFFSIIHKFLSQHAYSTANTEDFIQVAEEVTGKDWHNFFNEWFYGQGYPIVNLNAKTKGTLLQIDVSQKSSSPNNLFSPFPLDIQINLKGNIDTSITLMVDTALTTYTYLFKNTINQIIVDPEQWLLVKFVNKISIDTVADNLQLRVYPNPFKDCFNIIFPYYTDNYKNISLYEYNGMQVFNINTRENVVNCCPSILKNGIYLLVAQLNSNLFYQKISKFY
jgi:aminopeptidase N